VTVGRGFGVTHRLLARNCPLMISRNHCAFRLTSNGQCTVIDNKSLNGVWVNRERIEPHQPYPLKEGDVIQLGVPLRDQEQAEYEYRLARHKKGLPPSVQDPGLGRSVRNMESGRMKRKHSREEAEPGPVEGPSICQTKIQRVSESHPLASGSSWEGQSSTAQRLESSSGSSRQGQSSTAQRLGSSTAERLESSTAERLESSTAQRLESSTAQRLECSTAERLECSTAERLECSTAERLECSTAERLECSTAERLECSTAERLECSTAERLECSTAERLECSTAERLECSTAQRLECSTAQRLECSTAQRLECSTAQRLECSTAQRLECSTAQRLESSTAELLEPGTSWERKALPHTSISGKLRTVSPGQRQSTQELRVFHERSCQIQELSSRLQGLERQRERQPDEQTQQQLDGRLGSYVQWQQQQAELLMRSFHKEQQQLEHQELEAALSRQRKELQDVIRAKDRELEETKMNVMKDEAAAQLTDVLENELQCIICSEYFIEAVTLNCSHSFCCHCILEWRKRKEECPICRQTIQTQTRSVVLDNCIERMLESLSETVRMRRMQLIKERKAMKTETLSVFDSESSSCDDLASIQSISTVGSLDIENSEMEERSEEAEMEENPIYYII
ncbi:E3 ubiquitin-protein ligase rnf8, partial [Heterodontus francisci]|uniref:E3 ubiquitin-protein ligase rnf8 n=1 Tax=Heterodontus francisci TaxID=7792 RepID=UPI00355B6A46